MKENQKIINMKKKNNNTPNQPPKFWKNKRIGINDSHETYNTNNQIKFKSMKWKSSLCDYSDAYILVSESITVAELAAGMHVCSICM